MTTIGKIKIMLANLPDNAVVESFNIKIKGITEDQASKAAEVHNNMN